MADGSAIEWTEATWNPTTGCDRVSPGCDNCYALTLASRLKAMGSAKYQVDGDDRTSGPGFALTMHRNALEIPRRWRRPRKVFVNSMSDLFHPAVTDEFVAEVFAVMATVGQHQFQVLTKRPQRMRELLTTSAFGVAVENAAHGQEGLAFAGLPSPNVWLGASIESDRYVWRARHVRETPAAIRFLSLEPLVAPVPSLELAAIDWVIVGGESGAGARPMDPGWVREIRDACHDAGVAFFFKQWGGITPKSGGRELDGVVHDDLPTAVVASSHESEAPEAIAL
ncbi:MAG TPA: phage Gp37/Gp68 family protein [Acidimicrobiales bacterium]|nr:phage Gp37/Gp68 family protein [Acidimicrobiales bacterium]